MPTTFAAMVEQFARSTTNVWTGLVEIDHPDWAEPIRYCYNREEVVHDGDTYEPAPFEVEPPSETAGRTGRSRLKLNILETPEVRLKFRQVRSQPTVTIRIVRTAEPDVVTRGPFTMSVTRRDMVEGLITLQCESNVSLKRRVPFYRMDPANCPGLFKGTTYTIEDV